MEPHTPQKLYAYVDESGQDTEGRFFVVSIVLCGTERDTGLRLPGPGVKLWAPHGGRHGSLCIGTIVVVSADTLRER